MWLMDNHPTNRTLYLLAAISVLLFVISFFFEEHAGAQSEQLTFESPKISADQKIGGSG